MVTITSHRCILGEYDGYMEGERLSGDEILVWVSPSLEGATFGRKQKSMRLCYGGRVFLRELPISFILMSIPKGVCPRAWRLSRCQQKDFECNDSWSLPSVI
jgi:hypothetical protein